MYAGDLVHRKRSVLICTVVILLYLIKHSHTKVTKSRHADVTMEYRRVQYTICASRNSVRLFWNRDTELYTTLRGAVRAVVHKSLSTSISGTNWAGLVQWERAVVEAPWWLSKMEWAAGHHKHNCRSCNTPSPRRAGNMRLKVLDTVV